MPRAFLAFGLFLGLLTACGTEPHGPPFAAIEPVFMSEGQLRQIPLSAGHEGDEVVFRLEEGSPSFAELNLNADGPLLVLAPGFDDAGKYEFEVSASVDDGPKTVRKAVVNVADVNRAPVFEAIGPLTLSEGEVRELEIVVFDPDGDEVSLVLQGRVPSFVELSETTLTIAPGYADSGEYSLQIGATDERNVSSTLTIELTVLNVVRPPEFEPLEDVVMDEGEELLVELRVRDLDGDPVEVWLDESAPEWVVFALNPENTGADGLAIADVLLEPGFLDSGEYELRFVAKSNELESELIWKVKVLDVNNPPVLEPIDDVRIQAGEEHLLTLPAFDPDPEDAVLQISVEGLESWMEHSGLELLLAPPEDLRGSFFVTVIVEDRLGESAQRTFKVEVYATSSAPVILELEQRLEGVALESGSAVDTPPLVWGLVMDPDGDALRLEVEVVRADLPFSGVPTRSSEFFPGGGGGISTLLQLPGMRVGEYKWQARAVDIHDTYGDWQVFADGSMAFELQAVPLDGEIEVAGANLGWTRHRTATLNLSATPAKDAAMWRMAFSNDGLDYGHEMPWGSNPTSTTAVWQLGPGSDEQVVHAKVRDSFGNEGLLSVPIRVDELRPTGSLEISSEKDNRVDLALSFEDEGSGVLDACLSNFSTGPWSRCVDTEGTVKDWELLPGHGERTVYLRIRDRALNQRVVHDSIFVDNEPPDLEVTVNGGAEFTTSRDVHVSLEARDESGIKRACVKVGASADFVQCTAPGFRHVELGASDGSYEIWGMAEDLEDNRIEKSVSIVLDRLAPTVGVEIPGAQEQNGVWWVSQPEIELELSVVDETSGVAGIQFSHDGQDWMPLEEPALSRAWTLNFQGELAILGIRAVDRAGNFSAPVLKTFRLGEADPAGAPVLTINGAKITTNSREVMLFIDTQELAERSTLGVAFSNDGVHFEPEPSPLQLVHEWELADGAPGPRQVFARVSGSGKQWDLEAEILYDPSADDVEFLVINSGSSHTADREVLLSYGGLRPDLLDDPGLSLVEVCVSTDNFVTEDCTLPQPSGAGASHDWTLPDSDGEHSLELQFRYSDSDDRQAQATVELLRQSLELDGLSINGGALWARHRVVELSLESADWSKAYWACVGENENELFCHPAAPSLIHVLDASGDDTRTVFAELRDLAGNTSSRLQASIGYDPVPPVFDDIFLGSETAYLVGSRNVNLSTSAFDTISGLDTLWYSVDGGDSWEGPHSFGAALLLDLDITLPKSEPGEDEQDQGARTVWVRILDKAGNEAMGSASIVLDDQSPKVGLVVGNGSGWSQSNEVELILSASDSSGIAAYCLSNEDYPGEGMDWESNCSPWTTWSGSSDRRHLSWELEEGDGPRTVFAYVKDNAYQFTKASAEVQVRSVAPVLAQLSLNGGAEYARSPQVEVSIVVEEDFNLLPDLSVEFSFDGGLSWELPMPVMPTTKTVTFLSNSNGERTLHARVSDPAGNRSAIKSDSIILDTQAPAGLLFINDGAETTHSEHVTLTLSYDDNFEVRDYCLRESPSLPGPEHGCWSDIVDTLGYQLPLGDGVKQLYVWFRDAAGNVSAAADARISLNTTPPGWAGFDEDNSYGRHRGVELAWHPAEDRGSGVAGYQVGWSLNDQNYEWLPEQSHTSASIEPLPNGRQLHFRVRSYDEAGYYSESPALKLQPTWPFTFRQREPSPNKLRSVARAGTGPLVAVGDGGVLLRSPNEQSSFVRVDSMVDSNLNSVAFSTDSRGAAVAASGELSLTRDGGISWESVKLSEGALHDVALLKIYGVRDTWLVAGDEGLFVYKPDPLQGIEGQEDEVGLELAELPSELSSSRILGVAVCPQGVCGAAFPQVLAVNDSNELLLSEDGGESFTVLDAAGLELRELGWYGNGFVLLTRDSLFTVDTSGITPWSVETADFELNSMLRQASGLTVLGSSSEGQGAAATFDVNTGTFHRLSLPEGTLPLKAAVSLGGSNLLAVGEGGTLLRRLSGAWLEMGTGRTESYAGALLNDEAVWMARDNGLSRVDRSTKELSHLELAGKAGEHWSALVEPRSGELVVVGDKGTIKRSTDGGQSFTSEASDGPDAAFVAVSCIRTGEQVGCVASGAPGALAVNTDDSGTWKADTGASSLVLTGVVAVGFTGSSEERGIQGLASGSDGRVWSFEGNIRTSTTVHPTGAPLYAIARHEQLWLTAGADGFIGRSSDNGEVWSPAFTPENFEEDILALSHAGEGMWLASGSGGSLLLSLDEGLNWSLVPTGTGETLSALAVEGRNVWLGGSHGALLVSESLGH